MSGTPRRTSAPTVTCKPFDVVAVPFPFTDSATVKRRPALVLSATAFQARSGHLVLAMITSSENRGWPLDVALTDLGSSGLPHPSVVRMKLFTLDERFVLRRLGSLSPADVKSVQASLALLLPAAT